MDAKVTVFLITKIFFSANINCLLVVKYLVYFNIKHIRHALT